MVIRVLYVTFLGEMIDGVTYRSQVSFLSTMVGTMTKSNFGRDSEPENLRMTQATRS